MAKAGNYYYDQLNKEQQRAYYAMKEGLLSWMKRGKNSLSMILLWRM